MQKFTLIGLLLSVTLNAMDRTDQRLVPKRGFETSRPVNISLGTSVLLDIISNRGSAGFTEHFITNFFGQKIAEQTITDASYNISKLPSTIQKITYESFDDHEKFVGNLASISPEIHEKIFFQNIFENNPEAMRKFNGLPCQYALLTLAKTVKNEQEYPITFLPFGERYIIPNKFKELIEIYKNIDEVIKRGDNPKISRRKEHLLAQSSPYMKGALSDILFSCKLPFDEQLSKAVNDGAKTGLTTLQRATIFYALVNAYPEYQSLEKQFVTHIPQLVLRSDLCYYIPLFALAMQHISRRLNIGNIQFSDESRDMLLGALFQCGMTDLFKIYKFGFSEQNDQPFAALNLARMVGGIAGTAVGTTRSFLSFPISKNIRDMQ